MSTVIEKLKNDLKNLKNLKWENEDNRKSPLEPRNDSNGYS